MSAKKTVRDNIRVLRESRRITQLELANRINIKRSLVGSWEEGRSAPKIDKLILLADTFEITVDELIRDNIKEKLSVQK